MGNRENMHPSRYKLELRNLRLSDYEDVKAIMELVYPASMQEDSAEAMRALAEYTEPLRVKLLTISTTDVCCTLKIFFVSL
jgi:hypothetical protein